MSDDTDELGRFRPNLRPILLALVANVIFGGGLIGWPYLRGQERAEQSAQAFARFSACLFDGELAPRPGLVLPRGERARFATLALTDPSWPGRCRPLLAAIAHEPVIMLFPEVKGGEQEVAAGATSLDRALVAFERDRASARIAEAPLVALSRLQALLASHVRNAGAEVDPMRDAITLGDATQDLPTPSIVPIRVGEGGSLTIALEGGALLATAMDDRVIGHVRVDPEGGVDQRLARRRPLVSAVLGAREPPWVVMSTPSSQCGEDGCAHRATGVVALIAEGQRLTSRAWLRGHPVARDAVHLGVDAAFVAAVGEPNMVVRRFALPPADEGEPVELAPLLELEVAALTEPVVRFVDGDPPALAWVSAEGAGVVRVREGAAPAALESPGGAVVLASCGDAGDGWIGLFSERGARLSRADGSDPRTLDVTLLPPEPSAARLVCGEGAVDALLLTEAALLHVACDASGCAAPRELARDVERFDAARLRDSLLVAWSTAGGPVRVARVGDDIETSIPAACWAPASGLCGAPFLAADEERAVLVTRQDGDLRVVASEDGRSWHALRGLEQP